MDMDMDTPEMWRDAVSRLASGKNPLHGGDG
jgi:hypothetical protein